MLAVAFYRIHADQVVRLREWMSEIATRRHTGFGTTTVRGQGVEMKTVQYLVRINKDERSDWGASVPDLPGCVATGKTIDSTLRRIEQAIELHLRGMREGGLKISAPRHRAVRPRRTRRQVDFYATVEVAA